MAVTGCASQSQGRMASEGADKRRSPAIEGEGDRTVLELLAHRTCRRLRLPGDRVAQTSSGSTGRHVDRVDAAIHRDRRRCARPVDGSAFEVLTDPGWAGRRLVRCGVAQPRDAAAGLPSAVDRPPGRMRAGAWGPVDPATLEPLPSPIRGNRCRRRLKTDRFRRSKSERVQCRDSCSALMLGRVSTPRSRRR